MVFASATPDSRRGTHIYNSGGHSSQLDYRQYCQGFNSSVINVNVIPNEECVKQHHMCSVWLHHSLPPCDETQILTLQGKNDDCWGRSCYSCCCRCLQEPPVEIKSETWWWNEQAGYAINEKCVRFKACNAMQKGGMVAEAKGGNCLNWRQLHNKHVMWLVRSGAGENKFATVSPDGEGVWHIGKKTDGPHKPGHC